jgi:hypothetical protein
VKEIAKTLSANDTSETGAHQAGMYIPKRGRVLEFFPELDTRRLNPRESMRFLDPDGKWWDFEFIYYNGKQFGKTRDEYRLTRMTQYIRENGLVAGDTIFLAREGGQLRIRHQRKHSGDLVGGVLRLGTSWRAVSF